MPRQHPLTFFAWTALWFLVVLPRCAPARSGSILGQADYLNQLYEGAPTNAPGTALAQAASVALFSGEIGDGANATAPTDGQFYLTQAAIGQPVGGVPFAFYLPGMELLGPTNGMVFTSPANIALHAQAWQLAFDEYVQRVAFYASGAAIGTNVLVAKVLNSLLGTNNFQTSWTMDSPGACTITAIAKDNLGGSVTSARVHVTVVPVIFVNGQFTNTHSFTFLATNTILVTMTNPLPGGFVLYTTDGSDPIYGQVYQTPLSITGSVLIRAETTDPYLTPLAEVDPVAVTVLPLYSLTASTAGGGALKVSPPGPYLGHTVVTLTATPTNNWSFQGWTGDAATNASTFTLTMESNVSVQAVFGTSLTVPQTLGGQVLLSPMQSLYPYGSAVSLTAAPSNNFYFQTWLDAVGFAGSNNQAILLVTNSLPVVLAHFVTNGQPNLWTLTVEVGGGDGVVASTPYATLYTNGASVTITATPASSQVFAGWSGNAGGLANPLTVTVNTNLTILATFSANLPPAILITNPANFAQFTLPASIAVAARASDPNSNGAIAQVAFFADTTNLLAQVTNPPFAFLWTNPPAGTNLLTAVALDNFGLASTSAPVSVTVLPTPVGPPVFSFSQPAYTVSEDAGSVTLTVVNGGGLGGIVSFQTVDGTAFGGSGFAGSYTMASGSLAFANGQASSPLVITIIDNDLDAPAIQFQVQLSNPTAGSLGSPSAATVTILLNDPGGATNSLLQTVAPSAQPAMDSQLTVVLIPTAAGGQWRFPWDLAWRASGDTVAGLVAGNYPIDFNNVPNYLAFPQTLTAAVTGAAVVTNEYYPTVQAGTAKSAGSLTVNFTGAAGGGGWQFVGGTAWLASGLTTNLLPNTYFIQFEPVSGWSRPASQAVQVVGGENISLALAYLVSQTPPAGVAFPAPVPSGDITDNTYPYRFNGQLQTDVGFGSGAAVRENIVLTAAHMVFNDQTLAYVSQALWDLQQEAGLFAPEPLPARGWYVLSGYAAQRTNDLTNGYGPDESSPQSRDLDVAALYFLSPAARGGYGGYLASDATPNQWLNSTSQAMLVGYPVDGSIFGQVVSPGAMYATFPQTTSFLQETDQVYETASFLSFPGNSGGPVCVLFTNNVWYPAAVYLGTLGSDQASVSIMRAIDSNVVNLINLAASQGDAGTNNSGGGVITIVPGQGIAQNPGLVEVTIAPPAAFEAGGAWKFSDLSDADYSVANPSALAVTSTSSLQLQFKQIPGWNAPTNRTVSVGAGSVTSLTATYTPAPPLIQTARQSGRSLTFTWSAVANQTFQIQSATNLTQTHWTTLTGTITASSSNATISEPISTSGWQFYRVVRLP